MLMTIYLGADHAGFKLKESLKKYFDQQKIKYQDLGTDSEESVDYPDFAKKTAEKVIKSRGQGRGILICGSGIGMSIAANKIKGAYAALAWSPQIAKQSREHGNVNILVLPGQYLAKNEAIKIARAWLKTKYSRAVRHQRRLKKIKAIESMIKV